MEAFNTVKSETSCPFCGSKQQWSVQFKYGDCRQYEYRIGDKLRWGGNKKGSNVGGCVRTGGLTEERCRRCSRGYIEAAVYFSNNVIERVELLKQALLPEGCFEKIS